MAAAAPASRSQFEADARAALQVSGLATVPKTQRAKNKIFGIWSAFCQKLGRQPSLSDVPAPEDKLTYLLVFLWRYRAVGQRNKPVRAGQLSSVLTAVGQGISHLGYQDPRYPLGSPRQHTVLTDFVRALQKQDDPTKRAYPANVTILRGLFDALDTDDEIFGTINRHTQWLIIVAFYWLLRPAEYLETPDADSQSQAFRLRDVQFTIHNKVWNAADPQCPLHDENDVQDISYASLTFSDQKNAEKGELVGHRATKDEELCPVKSLGRIALHLRTHKASADAPLHNHYNSHHEKRRWYSVKPDYVTNALRWSASFSQQRTSIDPKLISARSLRPGGATALLCAGVDKNAIQLLGRWKSDAMLRYLHIQAAAHSWNFAQSMLDAGSYTFHPQSFADGGLPNELPANVAEIIAHEELFDDA